MALILAVVRSMAVAFCFARAFSLGLAVDGSMDVGLLGCAFVALEPRKTRRKKGSDAGKSKACKGWHAARRLGNPGGVSGGTKRGVWRWNKVGTRVLAGEPFFFFFFSSFFCVSFFGARDLELVKPRLDCFWGETGPFLNIEAQAGLVWFTCQKGKWEVHKQEREERTGCLLPSFCVLGGAKHRRAEWRVSPWTHSPFLVGRFLWDGKLCGRGWAMLI